MKITEITNVVRHPAMKRKDAFDNLLMSQDQDDLIAFIMDDNNSQSRRLALLKRLDLILGDVKDSYNASDLESFMHDQGPKDWQTELRNKLNGLGDKYKGKWDTKISNMTDEEEAIQFAKDLKIPPYHLSAVDETEDDKISTGEYEICRRCGGAGCIECEEGLKDITGMHKVPNFDNYQGE